VLTSFHKHTQQIIINLNFSHTHTEREKKAANLQNPNCENL